MRLPGWVFGGRLQQSDGRPVSIMGRSTAQACLGGDFAPTVTGPAGADDLQDVDLHSWARHVLDEPEPAHRYDWRLV
jgi:hypothetical protein